MINRAILILGHRGISKEKLGALSVLERQILTAAQAGIEELWIGGHEPVDFQKYSPPKDMTIHWISSENNSSEKCDPPYLSLSDQHLISLEKLRAIAHDSRQETISFVDSQGRSIIQAVMRQTEDFRSPEIINLNSDDAVFLERPFSSPTISKWLRAHPLMLEKHLWMNAFKRWL
jgi:hypothetical protein